MDLGFANLIGCRTFESGAKFGVCVCYPGLFLDFQVDKQEDCVYGECLVHFRALVLNL